MWLALATYYYITRHLFQDSNFNTRLFDNRSQELPSMVIYVNILKNIWFGANILVAYQNIKLKQIQNLHRPVIDFNMSTFHWGWTSKRIYSKPHFRSLGKLKVFLFSLPVLKNILRQIRRIRHRIYLNFFEL